MTSSSESAEIDYPYFSLLNQNKLVAHSTNTLEMIGRLDETSELLSRILDDKSEVLGKKGDAVTAEEKKEVESLLRVLEILANQKVALAIRSYDLVDNQIKIVDNEMTFIEKTLRSAHAEVPSLDNLNNDKNSTKNKRKRADSGGESSSNNNIPAAGSTAEPVYCTCQQVAFGDMIACDNEDCPIEWFHYACVNLTRKPRNSWICPVCSNKRRR